MQAYTPAPGFWRGIDTVLLDLDGTLLDLHYDSHFWHDTVPAAWGARRGLDAAAALAALRPRFRALEGTLDWYSTDYWSRELGLDIVALKLRDPSRIGWLPGAREFVRQLRAMRKRVVLATNSHPAVLAIKHQHTGVVDEVDVAFSSHQFGAPKESAAFWTGLHAAEPYDAARTLFVDDNASVLRAAHSAGIAALVAIRKPDSVGTTRPPHEFPAVDSVAALLSRPEQGS
jgi:putative hydrolase of the HAD superfamily